MFWNDILEIKKSIETMDHRICKIFHSVEKLVEYIGHNSALSPLCDGARVVEAGVEDIKELLCDVFCLESESNTINRLHDKIDILVGDSDRKDAVSLAQKTLDKFEDYMKNVHKFNGMINEFKGCVAVARSALEDRKALDKQKTETAVLTDITHEIYKSMRAFINAGDKLESKAHYKMDAIYKAVCEKEEKKSPKSRKPVKKKASPPL